MTIVEFLEARLAEDEASARAAVRSNGKGEWSTMAPPYECVVESDDLMIYDEGGHTAQQAGHIALHDPARVLREVEAKRAIMREHAYEQAPAYAAHSVGLEPICSTCGGVVGMPPECPTVRALAAVYADHPDYDQAWAAS